RPGASAPGDRTFPPRMPAHLRDALPCRGIRQVLLRRPPCKDSLPSECLPERESPCRVCQRHHHRLLHAAEREEPPADTRIHRGILPPGRKPRRLLPIVPDPGGILKGFDNGRQEKEKNLRGAQGRKRCRRIPTRVPLAPWFREIRASPRCLRGEVERRPRLPRGSPAGRDGDRASPCSLQPGPKD